VLWLEPGAVDLIALGLVILGVGAAMMFFAVLAIQEQRNPDRRDPGTTPAIRTLIAVGALMLFIFMMFYTYVSDTQLAAHLYPQCPIAIDPAHGCPGPITGLFIARTIYNVFLGIAILCTLAAFGLRLHYLMRPVRKRTMSVLYIIGINLAQFGVFFILLWFLTYPLLTWMHSWSFIGLGGYLTLCAKLSAVPQSCGLTAQGGYIVDTIVTTAFFGLLIAAIAAWKTRRNLVVIGGVTIAAVLSLQTLIVHTNVDEVLIGALLCGGGLVLAAVWTSVARREFAVVGEKNLGCGGQWLVLGTCLLIYIAAFAFFSLPVFPNETEPNIPFTPGTSLTSAGGSINAVVVVIIVGLIAGLQFYLLTRNRYKL
jgi:hypothetical protein